MQELILLNHDFSGVTIITLCFLMSAFVLVQSNRTVSRGARHVFAISLVALVFIALADWFNFVYGPVFRELGWFQTITTALTFAIAPAIPVAIANTIFPERYSKLAFVVLTLNVVLELATVFGGFVFWVDEGNGYHRGSLYMAYMATYVFSALYLTIKSVKAGRTYQSANLASVLSVLVVLGVGVGVQVYDRFVRTTWPAVSMAVVLYFLFYSEMVLRTDALTKLLNRHSYEEFLADPPLPCTVVVIDVDNFKSVNDNYGHAYGDVCLARIGSLIQRSFASSGLCYRTGGDEFMVVMTKNQDKVEAAIDDLNALIAAEQQADPHIPGVSTGYAATTDHKANIQSLINEADEHMYSNKRLHKTHAADVKKG